MWLRVNRLHHSRSEYLELLTQADINAEPHPIYRDAVRLITPCAVNHLPGFELGWVTVQDASAQGCVDLLDPQMVSRSLIYVQPLEVKPLIFWKPHQRLMY